MNIQVAVLCDGATDYQGKLSLLGTFDTILAAKFPALHSHCSFALRLAFSRIEEGPHAIKINFTDEDGKLIMPSIPISIDVKIPPDNNYLVRNLIINIQQLKFDRAGQHMIEIAIDGRHELSVPILVRAQPPETQPSGSTPQGSTE